LGANTFQIFSASPRMWRASPPGPLSVTLLRKAREQFDLRPLVIHVNYLVNLAALDPLIRAKSITAFRGELERAAVIGAEYLVVHPGSYRGQTLEQGIEAFVAGFLDSWLDLRSLGDMPPDRDHFLRYYADDLQNAMRRETHLFTRHLLAGLGGDASRGGGVVRICDLFEYVQEPKNNDQSRMQACAALAWVAEKEDFIEVAKKIQLMLEYNPCPPFACGSPGMADAGVVQEVGEVGHGTGGTVRLPSQAAACGDPASLFTSF
jgi:hypothetical protein